MLNQPGDSVLLLPHAVCRSSDSQSRVGKLASVKGLIVNISGLEGHLACSQLLNSAVDTNTVEVIVISECGCGSVKYSPARNNGWIRPTGGHPLIHGKISLSPSSVPCNGS